MRDQRLFHVSEEPAIRRFEPRPDRSGNLRVWTVCDSRLQNYLLPRDCPRVTYYARGCTSKEDVERHLANAHSVVAIESAWLQRSRDTRLFVYEFDPHSFQCVDEIAGYYACDTSVHPIAEATVDSPLEAITNRGSELRVLPSLWYLREAVAVSSLGYSVIRMRNAQAPPSGFVSAFPVPER
jgi:hypothetical protein